MPAKNRWAIYMRYSHEEGRDTQTFAIQERKCREYIVSRSGEVAFIYSDEAESGTSTLNRTDYKRLLADARNGLFTHVVVSRWDRFHRDSYEAMISKEYMRRTLKIEVHSATQPSAHEGAAGMIIEGIFDLMAAHYSMELSEKYRDAKYQIWLNGGYNGGKRLLGYDVGDNFILQVREDEKPAVLTAFELYATGKYGYSDIARVLNEAGYRAITGRKFNKNSIRSLLQNPVYIGQIGYQETRYLDREKKRRDLSLPIEYRQGAHEPIISQEIWDKVIEMRQHRFIKKHGGQTHKPYLLRGLVWCWHCHTNRHNVEGNVPHHGRCQCVTQYKTRKFKHHANEYTYKKYLCVSRDSGYECPQLPVRVELIDEAVLNLLFNLQIPDNWNNRLVNAIAREMGDANVTEKLEDLRALLAQMEHLSLTTVIHDIQAFVQRKQQVEYEIDRILPMIDLDLVRQAADLIQNFRTHFEDCNGDIDRQNQLISKIVERVYIQEKSVVAITFRSDIHLLLTHGTSALGVKTENQLWLRALGDFVQIPLANETTTDDDITFSIEQHEDNELNEEWLERERPWRDSNPRPTV
jgi:DNA invertase Pin-like site-specific DNA recombinase